MRPVSGPVRAELRSILFFGEGLNGAESFEPTDETHFGVRAMLFVGEKGDDLRSDAFHLLICSPSWFAEQVGQGEWFTQGAPLGMPRSVAVGSGIWFMRRWDFNEMRTAVEFILDVFSPAPDWGTAASRIARVIPWEFDADFDQFLDEHFGAPFPPPRAS